MSEAEFKVWEKAANAIEDRVQKAVEEAGDKFVLAYSAFDEDKDGVPIDNLDEVAHRGSFVVIAPHDDFWDGRGEGVIGDPIEEPNGTDFISEEVTDPTWLELAVLANKAILVTNDLHHIFFEEAQRSRHEDTIRLWFGS